MKNRLLFLLVVLGVLFPTFAGAQSGTITRAYVGCVTEDALSEFVRASSTKDYRHMQELLRGQCVSIQGREYSTIDRGFMTSTIRVYIGGGSLVLHVPSEAIR